MRSPSSIVAVGCSVRSPLLSLFVRREAGQIAPDLLRGVSADVPVRFCRAARNPQPVARRLDRVLLALRVLVEDVEDAALPREVVPALRADAVRGEVLAVQVVESRIVAE